MTTYETLALILTAIYDVLTFGLLSFVAYEAFIKPRLPNVALYIQRIAPDTRTAAWRRQVVDVVLENKGVELKNIRIRSEPDDLRWGTLRELIEEGIDPKRTSEYFNQIIPSLGHNEKLKFFWCDLEENADIVTQPISIILEFDDPAWGFKRCEKRFDFNIGAFENVVWGLTARYDIHNVAQELARTREQLETLNRTMNGIAQNYRE